MDRPLTYKQNGPKTKGRASIEFMHVLGVQNNEEDFSLIKASLRELAMVHFERGLTGSEQGEERWIEFVRAVKDTLPIFDSPNADNTQRLHHMRRYIDRMLANTACMHRKRRLGVQQLTDNLNHRAITAEAIPPRSPAQSPCPSVETSTSTSVSYSSTPPELSSMMLVPSACKSGSQDTYAVEYFLRKAQLEHLLPLFVSLGINSQERLDAIFCWPYVDRMGFLRDLVNEKRLDSFECKTLEMLFRGMAYGREV
ncbi:hypothetical protein SERLA73DRAFT_71523 [Serpula lacrymans var. lacrymans S7.3]|uniref:Uncharacterized protein n=2 Tax=Serpula lacrymans var. lacrymans TaxID=341189 RepID=F8PRB1_SERL3|nr:uncharacterized protein SERLADRAFT_435898 [Serpula lacrymans var. lacrymans S7.9]EGO02402.1 hypothetical protein SERLA73DRAFT_71523 [Serpula lacrymans var. lacrymans S7.3]EGO28128.1 hypothetical protein SERLADRAFT_435898 [Serpula lacrymans var. lacrymans S7.9]